MAAEASAPWWGRSVVWHTWPELLEPLEGSGDSLFWDTQLIVNLWFHHTRSKWDGRDVLHGDTSHSAGSCTECVTLCTSIVIGHMSLSTLQVQHGKYRWCGLWTKGPPNTHRVEWRSSRLGENRAKGSHNGGRTWIGPDRESTGRRSFWRTDRSNFWRETSERATEKKYGRAFWWSGVSFTSAWCNADTTTRVSNWQKFEIGQNRCELTSCRGEENHREDQVLFVEDKAFSCQRRIARKEVDLDVLAECIQAHWLLMSFNVWKN